VFNIDQPPPKGHRLAGVKIGEPINLKNFFEEYQENRNATIKRLVLMVQQAVQANLNQLNELNSPG
jgi:hypothetical protein